MEFEGWIIKMFAGLLPSRNYFYNIIENRFGRLSSLRAICATADAVNSNQDLRRQRCIFQRPVKRVDDFFKV